MISCICKVLNVVNCVKYCKQYHVEEEKIFDIQKQVYFATCYLKFEEIILETQVQLGKRFGDFVWVVAIEWTYVNYLILNYGQNLLTKTKKWGLDILQ